MQRSSLTTVLQALLILPLFIRTFRSTSVSRTQLLYVIWLWWVGSSGRLAVHVWLCFGWFANVSNSSAHVEVQVGLETDARHRPLHGDRERAVTKIHTLTGW